MCRASTLPNGGAGVRVRCSSPADFLEKGSCNGSWLRGHWLRVQDAQCRGIVYRASPFERSISGITNAPWLCLYPRRTLCPYGLETSLVPAPQSILQVGRYVYFP